VELPATMSTCTIDQGAVDEAEIHHFGRFGEIEDVAIAPAAEAVGALEELRSRRPARHLGGDGVISEIFLQMEIFGVVAADDPWRKCFQNRGAR